MIDLALRTSCGLWCGRYLVVQRLQPKALKVIRRLSLLRRFTDRVSSIGDRRCDLGMRV